MKTFVALNGLALAMLLSTSAVAAGDVTPASVVVSARFTPSAVTPGQATMLTWEARGGLDTMCRIIGLPGGTQFGDRTGAIEVRPTQTLTARVLCADENNVTGVANPTVTVMPADTAPVVEIAFSPASISLGQSSTFTWRSQYATSCTSTGGIAVSGTSGSAVTKPTANQTVTVTCSRGTLKTTKSATLVVTAPAPRVVANAVPSFLMDPGYATINYSSTNATSCRNGGPTQGSYRRFFMVDTLEVVTCVGPGGSASAIVHVYVQDNLAKTKPEEHAAPALAELGFALNGRDVQSVPGDFNNDGNADAIVVDANSQTAYIVIGDSNGRSHIAKAIDGVVDPGQIESIFIPNGGTAENILVTIAK